MRMRCPSCNGIEDYDSSPDFCKKCKRYVKLIRLEEKKKTKEVKT